MDSTRIEDRTGIKDMVLGIPHQCNIRTVFLIREEKQWTTGQNYKTISTYKCAVCDKLIEI